MKFAAGDASAVRDAAFWELRYKWHDTGWDLAAPAPPLVEYFQRADAPKPPGRVLVPGAGRGHDALFLAKLGFKVLAVDFAKHALDGIRRRRRDIWIPADQCKTLRSDILHLPARLSGSFELIVEHTCFCAIDPKLRDGYVTMARQILVPGGMLIGLFYPFRAEAPGPPFPVSESEMRARFEPFFEILHFETPANSVEKRKGEERLIVMQKKN
ncbi:MAG: methyltransferase domain-containing protein [Planctomycetota bacterium]